MSQTMAFVHTTHVTVPIFKQLAAEHLPGVRVINVMEDGLLGDLRAGHSEEVERRLRGYVGQVAETAGAVMSCCSSIGPIMERIGETSRVPVWRVDEAMAEEAAARGARIGVIATVPTTLEPTAELIRRKAPHAEIEAVVVEGAFAALEAGRPAEHDEKVVAALRSLMERSDVVVLAQATMARLLDAVGPSDVPVLSSPLSGIKRVAQRLRELEGAPV